MLPHDVNCVLRGEPTKLAEIDLNPNQGSYICLNCAYPLSLSSADAVDAELEFGECGEELDADDSVVSRLGAGNGDGGSDAASEDCFVELRRKKDILNVCKNNHL
ncbi:hypothetical protein RvY_03493 [Ramazzottius varieornatus]|uniref:Uncharacterized protein n=1 Tax=Ramazzottius varieornatus TaxID=947166 RepID=A0A1D1UN97_RAMVA|nr:hypothetical protein RvY_03493 [Ramazzottius varieornatus]